MLATYSQGRLRLSTKPILGRILKFTIIIFGKLTIFNLCRKHFFLSKLRQYAGLYIYNFPILAAAFDTVDNDILIICLSSYFGMHVSVLNWFKSYLSSRCFCVKCASHFRSSRPMRFPKGTVVHIYSTQYVVPCGVIIICLLYTSDAADE